MEILAGRKSGLGAGCKFQRDGTGTRRNGGQVDAEWRRQVWSRLRARFTSSLGCLCAFMPQCFNRRNELGIVIEQFIYRSLHCSGHVIIPEFKVEYRLLQKLPVFTGNKF